MGEMCWTTWPMLSDFASDSSPGASADYDSWPIGSGIHCRASLVSPDFPSFRVMASPSPFRTLPAERRIALVTHALTNHKGARAAYMQRLVARGGGFRAATLVTWPADRLAREVVRLNAASATDELELLQLLYVDLEPAIQITFLDAAGVAHEKGVIDEKLEPPYASNDVIARAATLVSETHGADGVHYLRTLERYNLAAWPGLDSALATIVQA